MKHEIFGEGDDAWHVVTFTENQTDLLATLYPIATKLPLPTISGADLQYTYAFCKSGGTYNYIHASEALKIRVKLAVEKLQVATGKSIVELADYIKENYLDPISTDMNNVKVKLISEGRIDYIDAETQTWIRAKNPPQEPVRIYRQIREQINLGSYADAVDTYYESLGEEFYSDLTSELIYLKRLGNIPLSGRDILYFRSKSSRSGLIASNLKEYVACIDETLSQLRDINMDTPMEIIIKNAPTMRKMIEDREREWHDGVFLWDSKFRRDDTPITLDSFSSMYDACPEGRLFERYPDQVRHCMMNQILVEPASRILWTTFSPSYYQTEILEKGLHLIGIEAYSQKLDEGYKGKKQQEIDFLTINNIEDLAKHNYYTCGIDYTGRVHQTNGENYYEINLLYSAKDHNEPKFNPLMELLEEILREAENLLREDHGIPRIGEGWISETELYWLVGRIYPDALQHASPKWLKPQHLDVYVPSKKLAFEYQGRQHYEPVEFFGGKEAYDSTIKRDQLKARKCKKNDVVLILWKYTEPIDRSTLVSKLDQVGMRST